MSSSESISNNLNTPKLTIEPGTKEYFNEMGLQHEREGKFFQAVQMFNEALKIDPKFMFAWFNNGKSLTHLGQIEDALKCYDQALEIDPMFKEAWYNKGYVYNLIDNNKRALDCYNMAIQIDADFNIAVIQRITTLLRLKEFKRVSEEADKYIEKDYHNYLVWYNKGVALNYLGKYQEAMTCFDTAIELKSDYVEALAAKGFLHGTMKDYENELECYDKVLELDPTHLETWINKSNVLNRLTKYVESLKCNDIAVSLNPDHKQVWENRLVALEALGLTEEVKICAKEIARF